MMATSSARFDSRSQSAAALRVDGSRGLRGRLVSLGLGLLSAILGRLPPSPLQRLAHAGGGVLYRTQPARRELVRANLLRVCAYLAEHGLVGERSAASRAARDERALDRLVRAAFGHYVRGYLETAIVGAYARHGRLPDIEADYPALVEEAFGQAGQPSGPLILVGMHFGAIEVPGLWTSRRGLRVTAPMETISDPDLQAHLAASRAAAGLHIVPSEGAGREVSAALQRGEVVALVADRSVGGGGARVHLFGAPARLPVGPAALAVATGAPAWLVTTRRVGWTEYRVHLERIELPSAGTRRERLAAFLEYEARAFERAVAAAPEQWWTLFFPIWREEMTGDGGRR